MTILFATFALFATAARFPFSHKNKSFLFPYHDHKHPQPHPRPTYGPKPKPSYSPQDRPYDLQPYEPKPHKPHKQLKSISAATCPSFDDFAKPTTVEQNGYQQHVYTVYCNDYTESEEGYTSSSFSTDRCLKATVIFKNDRGTKKGYVVGSDIKIPKCLLEKVKTEKKAIVIPLIKACSDEVDQQLTTELSLAATGCSRKEPTTSEEQAALYQCLGYKPYVVDENGDSVYESYSHGQFIVIENFDATKAKPLFERIINLVFPWFDEKTGETKLFTIKSAIEKGYKDPFHAKELPYIHADYDGLSIDKHFDVVMNDVEKLMGDYGYSTEQYAEQRIKKYNDYKALVPFKGCAIAFIILFILALCGGGFVGYLYWRDVYSKKEGNEQPTNIERKDEKKDEHKEEKKKEDDEKDVDDAVL